MGRGQIVALPLVVLVVGSILAGCAGPAKGTAEWHSNQGYELTNQGRFDEAIVMYTEAIRDKPKHALAYYSRGIAYKMQGKKAEAIADFKKFITLFDIPEWIEMARQQIEELSK